MSKRGRVMIKCGIRLNLTVLVLFTTVPSARYILPSLPSFPSPFSLLLYPLGFPFLSISPPPSFLYHHDTMGCVQSSGVNDEAKARESKPHVYFCPPRRGSFVEVVC